MKRGKNKRHSSDPLLAFLAICGAFGFAGLFTCAAFFGRGGDTVRILTAASGVVFAASAAFTAAFRR